ncbi:MAG: 4-hydroxy-tetrahydrodipicolinate synthase [Spirochaetales bacterium]|nr:4-hydroxy-tetrahydrodipicolinate synthase [Spirochaetales bacterium]
MKGTNPIFRGAATALVTPFTDNGVDYESFGRLIEWQIRKGIDALVIAGTSGEGSTLSDAEHKEVIKYSVEKVAGRVPVIAGTGSNETDYAIQLSRYACEVGVDGLLVVTPYYNKATQKGLVKMYYAIADACDKPLIVYNVPSRTGVNIEPKTYVELAKHERIAAIKEANGNISKIVETAHLVGDKLDIYSGNDDQIVPILSVGGQGVISVLSNIMPYETSQICKKFWAGDVAGSAKMQLDLLPLINALFCEVNPIPAKAAVSAMGFGRNLLRLPLTEMESEHEAVLRSLMKEQGLL